MMPEPSLVWLDGRLVPADAPHLRVTDRGFQLGDGVFETLRARRGVLIEWDQHIARLGEGAQAMALRVPEPSVLAAPSVSSSTPSTFRSRGRATRAR
jgi:branched-chain amino acid aminotransferase